MDQDPSVFSLTIDPSAKAHLAEAAKWGRFLSIVGMVLLGIILLLLALGLSFIPDNPFNNVSGFSSSGFRIGLIVYALVFSLLWFFPCLFLYRFSTRMHLALRNNDQQFLDSSFQNLKVLFRYVGILTIIVLSLYLLAFVILLLTFGVAR